MESNLLTSLLSPDNDTRRRAEAELEQERQTNPSNVMKLFLDGMTSQKIELASLSCVLLKKYFLDEREGTTQISSADLEVMKQKLEADLNFNQSLTLLKRKGDLISKIYTKQDKSEDLLKLLVQWARDSNLTGRQFSMYLFEVLSDCHLSEVQLKRYKDDFMKIFAEALTDRECVVRVAALKATTAFLTSIDDS